MIKKIGLLFLVVAALLVFTGCSSTEQNNDQTNNIMPSDGATANGKVVIYFFWGEGCPHCAVEKPFLEEMEQKYPELEVKMFETWKNPDNAELFQKVAAAYGIQARGVPTTFIGDFEPIVGFADYMKEDLESKIKNCLERDCVDPGSKL
ncbi:MAG: thioredoxin family protein [Patescibacteria group bacterium]|nr:thioredoxin family protein [Patescibacteria group bacterium]